MAACRIFEFFDAPVGVMVSLRREMGSPQWADAGMFMATAMLLLSTRALLPARGVGDGLSTVARVVGILGDEILLAGMAVPTHRTGKHSGRRAHRLRMAYCAGWRRDGANGTAPTQSKL